MKRIWLVISVSVLMMFGLGMQEAAAYSEHAAGSTVSAPKIVRVRAHPRKHRVRHVRRHRAHHTGA